METTPEQRAARRYPVAYEVEWDDGRGVTRDVSTHGVRFVTEVSHPFWIGEMLRFFIIVPHLGRAVSRLCCEGGVVRVDALKTGMDVAVCFQDFRFEYASVTA